MTARQNSVISETKTLTALGSYRVLRHAVYVAQNFPQTGLDPYNIGHIIWVKRFPVFEISNFNEKIHSYYDFHDSRAWFKNPENHT